MNTKITISQEASDRKSNQRMPEKMGFLVPKKKFLFRSLDTSRLSVGLFIGSEKHSPSRNSCKPVNKS